MPFGVAVGDLNGDGRPDLVVIDTQNLRTPTPSLTVRLNRGGPLCRADWDASGRIEPADVAAFVNSWYSGLTQHTLSGDFDRNGAIEPADVAVFISTWFAALSIGC